MRSGGGSGGGGCGGGNAPNHKIQGVYHLVSWRLGSTSFTHEEGEAFCNSNGMKAISIDDSAKKLLITSLVSSEDQKECWTGGRMNIGRVVTWPNVAYRSSRQTSA